LINRNIDGLKEKGKRNHKHSNKHIKKMSKKKKVYKGLENIKSIITKLFNPKTINGLQTSIFT